MAAIQFFTNLNLNRNEIQNAVIENTTENDIQNPVIGQLIFDTDIASLKYYDGETWQISKARMPGLLVYKGMIRHDVGSEPSDPKTGDLYVFSSGGMTNVFGAVEVQIGDFLLYDGTETGWAWTVIQGNVVPATIANPGVIRLANNMDVITGIDAEKALVSKYLKNWENQTNKALRRKRVYVDQTVDSLGLILYHNIGKNNVMVNTYNMSNERIDFDVEKNDGYIVLKSNFSISGIRVVISA